MNKINICKLTAEMVAVILAERKKLNMDKAHHTTEVGGKAYVNT